MIKVGGWSRGLSVSCSNPEGHLKSSTEENCIILHGSFPLHTKGDNNTLLALFMVVMSCGWKFKRMEICQHKN